MTLEEVKFKYPNDWSEELIKFYETKTCNAVFEECFNKEGNIVNFDYTNIGSSHKEIVDRKGYLVRFAQIRYNTVFERDKAISLMKDSVKKLFDLGLIGKANFLPISIYHTQSLPMSLLTDKHFSKREIVYYPVAMVGIDELNEALGFDLFVNEGEFGKHIDRL
jgi:uncharacterized protein YqgQ